MPPAGASNRLWTAFLQKQGAVQLLADVAVYDDEDAQVQTDALEALCHLAQNGGELGTF